MTRLPGKSTFGSCTVVAVLVIVMVAVTASHLVAGARNDRAYLYDRVPDPCQVDGVCVPNAQEYGFYKVHWKHWPTEPLLKEEAAEKPTAQTELPGLEPPSPDEEGLGQSAKPEKSKKTPEEESTTDTDSSPVPPPDLGDRPPVPTLPGAADRDFVPPGTSQPHEPSLPKPEPPKIEPPKTPELPNPSESYDELFPSPFSPGNQPSEPATDDKSTSTDHRENRLSSGSKTVRDDRPPSPPNYLAGHNRVSPLRTTSLKRGDVQSTGRLEVEGNKLTHNVHSRTDNPLRIAEKSSPSVIRTVSHEVVLKDAPPADVAPVLPAKDARENPLRSN